MTDSNPRDGHATPGPEPFGPDAAYELAEQAPPYALHTPDPPPIAPADQGSDDGSDAQPSGEDPPPVGVARYGEGSEALGGRETLSPYAGPSDGDPPAGTADDRPGPPPRR